MGPSPLPPLQGLKPEVVPSDAIEAAIGPGMQLTMIWSGPNGPTAPAGAAAASSRPPDAIRDRRSRRMLTALFEGLDREIRYQCGARRRTGDTLGRQIGWRRSDAPVHAGVAAPRSFPQV